MSFIAIGIDESAVAREDILKIVSNYDENVAAFSSIFFRHKKNAPSLEATVISTCLRFEMLVYAGDGDARKAFPGLVKDLAAFLAVAAEKAGVKRIKINEFKGQGAIKHLFLVMSGFESEDIGEIQVTGQIKDSFLNCARTKIAGPVLSKIMARGIAAVVKIRRMVPAFRDEVAIKAAVVRRVARFLAAGENSPACVAFLGRSRLFYELKKTLGAFEAIAGRADVINSAGEGPRREIMENYNIIISNISNVLFSAGEKDFSGSDRKRLIIDLSICRNFTPDIGRSENIEFVSIDDIITSNWNGHGNSARRNSRPDFMAAAEKIVAAEARAALDEAELLAADGRLKKAIEAQAAEIEKQFGATLAKLDAGEAACAKLMKLKTALIKKSAAVLIKCFSGNDR